MIVLGVATDSRNQPIWPPIGAKAEGLSERVQQIANSVYPAIRIDKSPPLPLPGEASKAVMVIRIPESDDAPHAVDNGRKIYERTGDVAAYGRDYVAFVRGFTESALTDGLFRPSVEGSCRIDGLPAVREEYYRRLEAAFVDDPTGTAFRDWTLTVVARRR